MELIEQDVLHTPVEATYPLEQYAEAIARVSQSGRNGKILFVEPQ